MGGSSSQSAPAGTKGWDVTAPQAPTGLAISEQSAGVWRITWTASTSSDLRYYNVYYSNAGTPTKTPYFQVGSPPKAETSYIYWQADPNSSAYMGITAVDRQGNESAMVCLTGNGTPCP